MFRLAKFAGQGVPMITVSSVLPPAPRGSGARSVPAVTSPARQTFESRRHDDRPAAVELNQTASGETGQIDGAPYIDAEFVEILREAAETAKDIGPVDGTVRTAIEAYRTAGGRRAVIGAMLDIAS